ncbi:putative F-box protein [Panicum miliaceum]|uniref:F-box protein n=1 Tax=Panicum miliaceum TaxID=4540 RepID=A0A3L6S2Y1_PANMI|nr:putative F-box protein [Panicum miliaceum]
MNSTRDVGERESALASPPQKRGSSSAVVSFDLTRYGTDTWTEVAKHMCNSDLLSLFGTSRWLRRFVSDDSIWCDAFFRDLGLLTTTSLHTSHPPHRSWRQLYCKMLGMLQVLEARHTDVLPNEILEYEKLGDNKADVKANSTLCAIFDSHHITSQSTAPLLNLNSWIVEGNIGEPKTSATKHAVAVSSNLRRSNKGVGPGASVSVTGMGVPSRTTN